ncbi:tetraspanin [Poronia punctata]|nr:tetraspanin [Poronia punctata]
MVNKTLAAYIGLDFLFLATGAIILGFSIVVRNSCFDDELSGENDDGVEVARDLLYREFPFSAGIGNGIFTFLAFVTTLPGLMIITTNKPRRGWLKFAGFLISVNAVYTLILGLQLWMFTLRIGETFEGIWRGVGDGLQVRMQDGFKCCGYNEIAFQLSPTTCPSPAAASSMPSCAGPISRFANTSINSVFTAMFGIVGVDALLILATACLLKERKEMERFRVIDEKRRGTF